MARGFFMNKSRLLFAFSALAFALSACNCEDPNITQVICDYEVVTPDGAERIEFRSTEVGSERSRTFRITNTGNRTLREFDFAISAVNSTHYRVAVEDEFRIDPEGSGTLSVVFEPLSESPNLNTTITITHPSVSQVACPAFNVAVSGSSFEGINTQDAGPDASVDVAVDVVNQEGGPIDRDGGIVRPLDGGINVEPGARFSARGALQEARSEFASVVLPDNTIVVVGGYGENGQALTSIERFDPKTGVSTVVGEMASPRAGAAAAYEAQSNLVVIVGGRTEAVGGLVNTTVETYNPDDDVVTCPGEQGSCALDDISQGRGLLNDHGRIDPIIAAPSGSADADVVVLFGRELIEFEGELIEVVKSGGVVFDANTLALSPLEGVDVLQARQGSARLFNDEGRFALFGGTAADGRVLNNAVRLELTPNLRVVTLSPSIRPLTARTNAAAAILSEGNGYIMGGLTPTGELSFIVEKLIAPFGAFDTLEMAEVLDEGRVSPTLVAIENDFLLLAGGADRNTSEIEASDSVLPRRDAEVFIELPNDRITRFAPDNDLASPRLFHRAERVSIEVEGEDALDAVVFLGGTSVTPRRRPHPQIERFISAENKFEVYGLMGPGTAFSREAPNALYTLGGIDPHTGGLSPRVRVFNSIDDEFVDASPMAEPRRDHSATLLDDQNTLLVAGGKDAAGQVLSSLSLYNPFNESDIPLTVTLTRARARHTTNLLEDGRVLICGGEGTGGEALDTCEIFTPPSDLADPTTYDEALIDLALGRMSVGRTGHSATSLDATGEVLLVGGGNVEIDLVTADIFSSDDDRITATAQPVLARRDHGAINIGGGKVLIVGGEVFVGGLGPTAQSEVFDRAFSSFTALDDELLRARTGLGVVALADGQVVVAGGAETGVDDFATLSLRLTEIFDGDTNEFRAANELPLTYGRSDVSLLDVFGRGLVAGGTHRDGRLANGDERQTPIFFVDKLVSADE